MASIDENNTDNEEGKPMPAEPKPADEIVAELDGDEDVEPVPVNLDAEQHWDESGRTWRSPSHRGATW